MYDAFYFYRNWYTSKNIFMKLFSMVLYTLIFATLGFLSPEHRGNLLVLMVFLFIFMGIFAGYYSARFYRMFGVIFINLGKRLVKEFNLYIILISQFRFLAIFHDKLCFKNGKF